MARPFWTTVAALLLLPATAALAGNLRGTSGLYVDYTPSVASFRAAEGSIAVTPRVVDLGALWVGDKCTDAPIATVTTTWPVELSVSATGWLSDRDVAVYPSTLQPGEIATVTFTNAAVNGPSDSFTAVVTVVGQPGGTMGEVLVTGRVENPAESGSPPPVLPTGCIHPADKPKKDQVPGATPEGEQPKAEAPAPTPVPAPAPEAEQPKAEAPAPTPVPTPAPEAKQPRPEAPVPAPAPEAEQPKPEEPVPAPVPAPAPEAEQPRPEAPAPAPAETLPKQEG